MSELAVLGFVGVKAVNTLTPVWLLGVGALLSLVLIGLLWALLTVGARFVRAAWLRRASDVAGASFRQGALSWIVIVAAILAVVGLVGTFVLRSPRESWEILASLGRLPQVSEGIVYETTIPGSRVAAREDEVIVPPSHRTAVAFRGAELRALTITSSENVSVTGDPEAEMDSLATIDVKAGEPYSWRMRPDAVQPFGEREVDAFYFRNRSSAEASVRIVVSTDVVYPEVRAVVVTALAIFGVYLFYLVHSTFAPRMSAVAHATYKSEVVQPQFIAVLLLGLSLMALSIYIPYNTFGEDIKMLKDSGLTLIRVLCIFLAVWGASTTISEEIDGKTALTVLSKPIGRRSFVIGKFFGIGWTTALMYVFLGTALLVAVSYKSVYDARETGNEVPTWQACYLEMAGTVPGLLLGFMETLVLTALSVAISTRLTMVANFMICFSVYVLGHLIPLISQATEDSFEIVRFVARFSAAVFPNLEAFDLSTALAGGIRVPGEYLGMSLLYCFIFSLVALLLALILFEDRDLA
ncbi:MAG: hypothetical protein FJ276_16520 [Planctomycetes bacterium]|nr:hypothetical protein [Planctomycetota bacterium]